jgi:hypothetical protein
LNHGLAEAPWEQKRLRKNFYRGGINSSDPAGCSGRLTPHRNPPAYGVLSLYRDGKYLSSKLKEIPMLTHLLCSPVLASVYYVGGGFGLVALIVIIVLILR